MDEAMTERNPGRTKSAAQVSDWMNAAIVLSLLFGFLSIIGFAFYAAAYAPYDSYKNTLEVLNQFLPVVTGLLGLGIGFYFASGKSDD